MLRSRFWTEIHVISNKKPEKSRKFATGRRRKEAAKRRKVPALRRKYPEPIFGLTFLRFLCCGRVCHAGFWFEQAQNVSLGEPKLKFCNTSSGNSDTSFPKHVPYERPSLQPAFGGERGLDSASIAIMGTGLSTLSHSQTGSQVPPSCSELGTPTQATLNPKP